jgi:hypothetical protein
MDSMQQEIIDTEARRDACYAALKQAEKSFSKEAIEHYRKALIKLNKELQLLKNHLTSYKDLPGLPSTLYPTSVGFFLSGRITLLNCNWYIGFYFLEMKMKVLVACEYSARVRDAFRKLGHDAWSCDLLATEGDPAFHFQGSIEDFFKQNDPESFDLMIAHPPCTYLTVSGLHWNKRDPERAKKTDQALEFIQYLWELPIDRLCIENPVGCINSRLPFMPKPQYIQPYEFGEDASKKTGLWLRNLPPLKPTKRYAGRIVEYKGKQIERWSNQTDSGQNRLPPSDDRWKVRSTTYQGIADAMAEQWG